jgi:hypothetical protein
MKLAICYIDKLNCRKTERFLTTAVRDQLQELEKEGYITTENLITVQKTSMIPTSNIFRKGVCRFLFLFSLWIGSI